MLRTLFFRLSRIHTQVVRHFITGSRITRNFLRSRKLWNTRPDAVSSSLRFVFWVNKITSGRSYQEVENPEPGFRACQRNGVVQSSVFPTCRELENLQGQISRALKELERERRK